MDKIISQIKFDKISGDESNTFKEELNIAVKGEVNAEEIINAIKTMSDKVKEYHPLRHSDGYDIYFYCIYRIKDIISSVSNPTFTNEMINWIKSILESGWTAANSDFLLEVTHLLPAEYFSEMKKEKLSEHLAILDITDFELSDYDDKDNERYVRDQQNTFTRTFFIDHPSSAESNIDIYRDFVKHLYMKLWTKNGKTINIYSRLISSVWRMYPDFYLKAPDIYIQHFKEITATIIKEDVPTVEGQKEVIDFYSCNYSLIRKSKEIAEKIMDDWLSAFINLFNLDRGWFSKIIHTLAMEIRYVDQSLQKKVFNNCGHLFPSAVDILAICINKYPLLSDYADDNKKFKEELDYYNNIIQAMLLYYFIQIIKTSDQFEMVIPVLLKIIDLNNSDAMGHYKNFLESLTKPIQSFVKLKPELINPFINQFVETALRVGTTEDRETEFPFSKDIRRLSEPYDVIQKLGKSTRAFSSSTVQSTFHKCFLRIFDDYMLSSSVFIYNFQEYLVFKDYSSEDMVALIQSINKTISTDLFHIYNPHTYSVGNLFSNVVEFVSKSIEKFHSAIEEIAKTPIILIKFNLQWDVNGETRDGPAGVFIISIFSKLLMVKSETNIIKIFYPILMEVLNKTDESSDYYSSYMSYLFSCPLSMTNPEALSPYVGGIFHFGDQMKDSSMRSNMSTMLLGLQSVCKSEPSILVPHLDKLEAFMVEFDKDPGCVLQIIQLFTLVYAASPEKVNESIIDKIAQKMNDDIGNAIMAVTFICAVSKANPTVTERYLSEIILSLKTFKLSVATNIMAIFTNLLENNQKLGEKIFDSVVQMIEENIDDGFFPSISLNGLRSLGLIRHDLLVNLKGKIEKWQQTKPPIHDVCQHLLDVIADRSLATIDADLLQQKQAIVAVDNRLVQNEDKVVVLERDVKANEDAIVDVNKKVEDTNARVDIVESDVKIIDGQVQEIDMKTVSSAPKWAREVSKLMNPVSDNDWRLLASRLGYSNDDIRAWSTHADPCMSLLSDWFAVRRHIEATKSILEQLTEMNLTDVAKIVENALTAAEAVITDDDPIEFVEPPLVFLSYQWAVQDEVKVLRAHLQKAGYRCWMDIGQMGGGDKLYEAIDRGIRGAKVFISCVTEKYSQSPNCKRELNLAISLSKAVIPLQMEKMSWPPPGTMGPLLTEYIFIRMFAKPGGALVTNTFWPKERFQELLMQIRYSCAPEYENVDGEYKDWWQPPDEKIAYEVKEAKAGSATNDSQATVAKVHDNGSPEVFLSYQWGKQDQVKKLYSTLTNIGYSCWMDIFQMGGGDSLYDKIDRGVRGCKLMISCVTQNYSQSPNCRREVSLCDNLKKPLLPILLEQMTWPPEGPMSMVLTQLVYISFADSPDEQNSWKGPKTDELLAKMLQIIPNPKISVTSHVAPLKSESKDQKRGTNVSVVAAPKRNIVLPNSSLHLRSNVSGRPALLQTPQSKTCLVM